MNTKLFIADREIDKTFLNISQLWVLFKLVGFQRFIKYNQVHIVTLYLYRKMQFESSYNCQITSGDKKKIQSNNLVLIQQVFSFE